MPNTFLDAYLEAQRYRMAKQGRLDEIQQRALDRTMREKEINAQMSHQQAMQELARQQFEETKRRGEQDDAFRAAQGIASGQFFDARPQTVVPGRGGTVDATIAPPSGNTLAERLGPPSLVPSVPMLPEDAAQPQTIAPPGNAITIGGVSLVPVNPEVQQARALRSAQDIAEAQAMAHAKGQTKATELQRQDTIKALDTFMASHPGSFRNEDEKTDMYMWAVYGKEPRKETLDMAAADAVRTIVRGGGSEQIGAAKMVLELYARAHTPQPSPTFARDVNIDRYAGAVYQSVLNNYKQKDGTYKFPKDSRQVYQDMQTAAAQAGLPDDMLMPVAEAARKLLVAEKKPNFLDTLLPPKQ